MSVITLAMAKPSYVYEEIIGENVLIPIPEGREYTSLEGRNGFRDQSFSSKDLPKSIMTKMDFGNLFTRHLTFGE